MDLALRLAIPVLQRNLATSAMCRGSQKVNLYKFNYDRRIKIDYQDSIKYLDSQAYKKTYKGDLVWRVYRRNFKGQFPSENTRLSCINDEGFVMTSYPCPICRDEYLVLHHENTKLLQQFIDPHTNRTHDRREHGLCLRQYRNLLISIAKARDLGLMTTTVPERYYDYREYSH